MIHLAALLATMVFTLELQAQTLPSLQVKEKQLANGMTVWLNEDHSQPKVYGAVVVKAGAKDCPNTGIAHYFEHIMFKGNEEIGTIDYAAEKPWLDSIAAAYDKLAKTTDEAGRAAIQKDINRLSQEAGRYAIPNEFNSLISRYGGSGLNAGTSYDFTFYHNMFTPQFIEQWCWLNSDRLINPVFRLFQGELETVYEEKNRASDNMLTAMRESVMGELFGTQPYAYPVIGSTENLKNPKLSDMKRFYEQYYVGCNMGLVLCGDFDSDSIMPLLERTFGRIAKGVEPTHLKSPMPDITQERTVEVKLPIPLVSMEMLVYKGTTEFAPDANAMNIATKILSNGNAGLIDSLMNEGHLLAGAVVPVSLNDAGVAMLMIVPKLFGKAAKAEAACLEQVKSVCEGNFSDETFNALKREAYRDAFQQLETINDRAMQMVMVMSSGHTWQEYIDKINAIERVTKADVVATAKRYFGAPFMRFKKKFGNVEKDKVSQPGYTPVRPQNKNAESAYAKRLAAMPVNDVEPRLIDFNTDATTIALGGQATLYAVKNPVNDLFKLNVSYNKGTKSDPRLGAADILLNLIGTDSLTRQQLGKALQKCGADFSFESSFTDFSMEVTGEDKNFEATMQIIGNFLDNMKSNEKAMKNVKDAVKTAESSLTEENNDVLLALMKKIALGDNSPSLHRLTYKEVKKMTGEELIQAFKGAMSSATTIDYSGSLDANTVASAVKRYLHTDRSQQPYVDDARDFMTYNEPLVYVFDMPKSRQSLLFTYDGIKPIASLEGRVPAMVLSRYFGGDMSSVLFQEVREFRSMAYSTQSALLSRSFKTHAKAPLGFITITGTQGDKTMSAVALVDSLLADMPVIEKNFEISRQGEINYINNSFPSFRDMGSKIAEQRHQGFDRDINTGLAALLRKTTLPDMLSFYQANIQKNAQHRVIGIVGSKKKLDMKQLQKYGKVVILKEKDLFRK